MRLHHFEGGLYEKESGPRLLEEVQSRSTIVKNRQQRDLDWCVREPSLIKGQGIWPSDEWFEQLRVPDLPDLTAPPPRFRLGIHFEKLFQYWIQSLSEYELLEANLQIHGLGRTLGEFDLLVNGPEGHEHWELAVKFYINQANPKDAKCWFGPDPADTLASKLDRLLTHQLPLANREEAVERLNKLNIQIQRSKCIMKGRLYHPWDLFHAEQLAIPDVVNPNHNKGWWLAEDHVAKLEHCPIAYLDKSLWLSELEANDNDEVLNLGQAQDLIRESEQIALQFALLDRDGKETSRGFVLKPRWFELANQDNSENNNQDKS
jgi:hypothetical protein